MPDKAASPTPAPGRGRPKDPEKAQLILVAAADLFLEQGLKATSMDAIARRAGVSKQTLYSHFRNKDDLFRAVMRWKMNQHQFSDESPIAFSGDLKADLNAFGRHLLSLLTDTEACDMFRAVIGEAPNYPKMAELFYEGGPLRVMKVLDDYLESLGISDAAFHGRLFMGALKGEVQMMCLMGLGRHPSPSEIREHVARVVDVFAPILQSRMQKNP